MNIEVPPRFLRVFIFRTSLNYHLFIYLLTNLNDALPPPLLPPLFPLPLSFLRKGCFYRLRKDSSSSSQEVLFKKKGERIFFFLLTTPRSAPDSGFFISVSIVYCLFIFIWASF